MTFDERKPNDLPPKLLSVRDVMERTGLSRATIYKLEGSGEFPSKFAITESRVGWLESEVSEWIIDRASHRKIRSTLPVNT